MSVDLSVVLSTYNRCAVLKNALEKLLAQRTIGIEYEILVVDNNSSDATKETIQSFTQKDSRFRYIFEKRQGLSYARNAGIEAARAAAIAFTDDDVEPAQDWIQSIHEALLRYPDADFLGGRVLPLNGVTLPPWASSKMAPFALQDWGDQPIQVSKEGRRVLIGACLVARRRALDRAGLFNTETQRVKDSVGSTEDGDWENKVWDYGGYGVYLPDIICYAELPNDRLSKSYHRRWHFGHGKFNAKGYRPDWEGSRRVLAVPLFMYRQSLGIAMDFVRFLAKRQQVEAFERECDLLFYFGFMMERWKRSVLGRVHRG
jgi:glycosyltransferase involved in cell wall biosynthesis